MSISQQDLRRYSATEKLMRTFNTLLIGEVERGSKVEPGPLSVED